MGYLVTHIRVGKHKVGILGLEEIFKVVQAAGLEAEAATKTEILRRVKDRNYVPIHAEAEYRDALYREYRRFLGEKIIDDQEVLEVRVYGGD